MFHCLQVYDSRGYRTETYTERVKGAVIEESFVYTDCFDDSVVFNPPPAYVTKVHNELVCTLYSMNFLCHCMFGYFCLIVEAVRATLGSFGSDSSKSTKFGPDIPYTIPFRFFEGAKKSDTRGRHSGKIQYGRQSFQPQVVFKQPKWVK